MRITRVAPLILPFLVGCGGAQLILKPPIEDRCNAAGVQGCPEIVQGALVYIEGDKVAGKDQMVHGAAQNAPDKVKSFAKSIREMPLDKIPGAQKYTAVVIEIADILAGTPGAPVEPAAPPPPPPSGGAPKVVLQGMTLEGAQLAGIPDIEFDKGTAVIKASASNEATLRLLAIGGQQNPQVTMLRVEGHTDSDGDPSANQVLSERRAHSVVDWLVAHGIDRARLHPVGCGARDPIYANDTPEHKARNRRTEFDIEGYNGVRPEGFTEACTPNSYRRP